MSSLKKQVTEEWEEISDFLYDPRRRFAFEHAEAMIAVGAVYDRAYFPAINEMRAVIDRAYSST